jgi:large subunit ribosomal protein L19
MLKTIDFIPGDIVKVYQKITEGDKTRTQIFEGTVIQIKGRGENKSYTVRKTVGDVAIERIWPMMSPGVEKVEKKAAARFKVRRAKLYYLRNA